LVVVELGVVGLYGIEEEVARFLEERVDAEVEGIEVGAERRVCEGWVLLECRYC
jgi:hypothetical protein